MSAALKKAIDELLAFLQANAPIIPSDLQQQFEELDLKVYVEVRRLHLLGELPSEDESIVGQSGTCIGKTNLPVFWLGDRQEYAHVESSQWRTNMLAVRSLADVADRGLIEPQSGKVLVDLEKQTATLNGKTFSIKSDLALRWLKVLAEHPGQWITGPDLKDYDNLLIEPRTDRLRKRLPSEISSLIDSETGRGSRIVL